MEVLAIVAYKQPATKDDVDSIRGVDSGHILRSLMERRLVRITGRSDLPGRPMLYGTTHEFLELFNLKDAHQLPPLHEIEAMVATSEVGFEEKQAAVTEEFGKMVDANKKILFDDSKLDDELESIRNEIASIPTSTPFIEEQKAQEKLAVRVAELASRGLMLDPEGNEVPLGWVPPADAAAQAAPAAEAAPQATEHQPSSELEAQAATAQAERHAAMVAEAIGEAQQAALEQSAAPEQALETPESAPEEPLPEPEAGL
jgi:segregation and condensation protein B